MSAYWKSRAPPTITSNLSEMFQKLKVAETVCGLAAGQNSLEMNGVRGVSLYVVAGRPECRNTPLHNQLVPRNDHWVVGLNDLIKHALAINLPQIIIFSMEESSFSIEESSFSIDESSSFM